MATIYEVFDAILDDLVGWDSQQLRYANDECKTPGEFLLTLDQMVADAKHCFVYANEDDTREHLLAIASAAVMALRDYGLQDEVQ